ncbi:MAG: hypothetical protein HGB12_10725 [Bacteroidetes bacterium]|nr:hypothetical protein [Bacteroidota bacterium]
MKKLSLFLIANFFTINFAFSQEATNNALQANPYLIKGNNNSNNSSMPEAQKELPTFESGWNYNTLQIGKNKFQTSFLVKQINYLDEDNVFKPIVPTFTETTNGFVMSQAPFTVIAPLTSDGIAKFINNNRFDIVSETKINEPSLTASIQAIGTDNVSGNIEEADLGWGIVQYVIYKNAYPKYNADLIYWVHQGKTPTLKKLIRFNSFDKAPIKETAFNFRIFYDKDVYFQKSINNEMLAWAGKDTITDFKGNINTILAENKYMDSHPTKRIIGMEEFRIWDSGKSSYVAEDSAIRKKTRLIKITIAPEANSESFILSKIIPDNFFKSAVFPVYSDATLNCSSVAGDGSVQYWNNSSWTTAHNATSGQYTGSDGFDYASTGMTAGEWTNGNWQIVRAFCPIATTSLPGDAIISSASLWIYAAIWGTASRNVCMVRQTQASVFSLVNSDYGQISSTQKIAADKASGDWGSGAYLEWPLTDLAYITPGGYTKIGLRTTADYNNTQPGETGGISSIRTSEYTPSGTNPKLVITYIVPASPTVSTQAINSIAATTATGNGNVTDDGGAAITERGVCWNTSTAPNTSNNKTISSGTTGALAASMTGLTAGTLYYVRAYAINSVGISYGNEVTFTTLNIPTLTSPTATNITMSTAILGANVTSDGGASITARGTCWGTAANPTTNCVAEGGVTTGVFTHARTGLPWGTFIYHRAYATNSVGTGYSADGTFTTSSPTPATVDWNNSNVQEITLSTDRSLTFTNGKNGGLYTLIIKQNATGGLTFTWPSNVKWAGGVAPTLTFTPNAIDIIKFIYDGTNYLDYGIRMDIK